ncbi:MAG: HAMP domain-containing histidine kinase [Actinomycetia bacterium]|nr:HAMP domain-containing histidine kinase [Actinomycetes bacterium]MCP4962098.1 HAMP domain-containing histidine kinase [Actinomycetes bacterium]
MADVEGPAASALGSLRLKLTALIAGLAIVALVALSFLVIGADRRLRDEQLDSALFRATETVGAITGFESGELVVPDRQGLPGVAAALASRPIFTLADLPGLDTYVDEFASLTRRELSVRLGAVVRSLAAEERRALYTQFDVDNDPDLVAAILDDPPADLVREARRRFVLVSAREDGVAPPGVVLYGSSLPFDVPEDDVLELLSAVIATGGGSTFSADWAPEHLLRTVPIRDGSIVRGAAVVAVDRRPVDEAHQELRRRLLLAVLIMSGVAVATAWWIAGRAIKPAAAAIGQQERFLADAAHELRNPLAAIRATAERALGPQGSPAPALERIAAISVEAGTMTDDLLTLARMEAGALPIHRRPVRLDLLVESLVDDRPDVEMALDPVTVDADPGLVERALDNLIQNAVKHGGADVEHPVRIRLGDGELVVSDSGPGIGPTMRATLFDRFASRTESSGHGLGLALVAWVVESHGWTIEAGNEPGTGAVFSIRFD